MLKGYIEKKMLLIPRIFAKPGYGKQKIFYMPFCVLYLCSEPLLQHSYAGALYEVSFDHMHAVAGFLVVHFFD